MSIEAIYMGGCPIAKKSLGRSVLWLWSALALGGCMSAETTSTVVETETDALNESEVGHQSSALGSVSCHGSEWMDCGGCMGGDCVGCLERWVQKCSSEPYPAGDGDGYSAGDVGTKPSTSKSCISPACKSSCLAGRRACIKSCGGDEACVADCGTQAECIASCCR